MLRKDYLVRMIEEMTEMIGKIFDLKQQRKWIDALWQIDDLYRRLFRLNSDLIGGLSARDLVELMRSGGAVESEKLQSLAKLVKEEGDILLSSGDPDQGIRRQIKALHLFLAASQYGTQRELWNLEASVEELRTLLKPYVLPADTERLLLDYQEELRRYDQAEDTLFRLLKSQAITREEGILFYRRLSLLSPEELIRGGLSPEEVQEGELAWLAAWEHQV